MQIEYDQLLEKLDSDTLFQQYTQLQVRLGDKSEELLTLKDNYINIIAQL